MSKRIPNYAAHAFIAKEKEFRGSNMYALKYDPPVSGGGTFLWGWAEFRWPWPLRYVVFSFGTPIAWVDADGVAVRSFERHSTRTDRHQGHVGMMSHDKNADPEIVAERMALWEVERVAYEGERAEKRRQRRNALARQRRAEAKRIREEHEAQEREVEQVMASLAGDLTATLAPVPDEVLAALGASRGEFTPRA